jgi:GNAT superfamily N-acetyltransferase
MPDYHLICQKPTGTELSALRRSVGWNVLGDTDSQKGLDGTLFAVVAVSGGETVGTARVVGDGRAVFYVQDVIVRPDWQGRGIGRAMMEKVMEYIASAACEGAFVGLMAAAGREGFYEQFGFHARPNEREGAGMMQKWRK